MAPGNAAKLVHRIITQNLERKSATNVRKIHIQVEPLLRSRNQEIWCYVGINRSLQ